MRTIAGLQLTSRQPCWGTTTKRFPPLGTKLFYHANSAKKFFIVLTTNMAALSRGCKRSIVPFHTRANKFRFKLTRNYTSFFHLVHPMGTMVPILFLVNRNASSEFSLSV